MDSSQSSYWVRFISMWTNQKVIHRFDSLNEADFFAKQVNGEVYDYNYNVIKNYGYVENKNTYYLWIQKKEHEDDVCVGQFSSYFRAKKYGNRLLDNNKIVAYFVDEREVI